MCNSTLVQSNCIRRNACRRHNHMKRRTSTTTATSTCVWRVNNASLLPIDANYPLARTHIVIEGSSAPVISGRVSEFARLYSLATEKTPDAPHRLRCTTDSSLVFEINLWKKECINGNGGDIIVEICRRSGCSVEFRRVRCLLSKAVISGNKNTANGIKNTAPISLVPTRRPSPIELRTVIQHAQTACDLICKRGQTQDIITGLRMLAFLTDPNKTNRMFASGVCNMILTGVTIFGQRTEGREALYNHVLNCDGSTVHQYALKVLGNVLDLVSKKQQKYKEGTLDMWGNIVPSLVRDMETARSNPHAACNAMRCLRLLYVMQGARYPSIGDSMRLDMSSIRTITGQVWTYGKVNHVALEQEAREIIKMMNPGLAAHA